MDKVFNALPAVCLDAAAVLYAIGLVCADSTRHVFVSGAALVAGSVALLAAVMAHGQRKKA